MLSYFCHFLVRLVLIKVRESRRQIAMLWHILQADSLFCFARWVLKSAEERGQEKICCHK